MSSLSPPGSAARQGVTNHSFFRTAFSRFCRGAVLCQALGFLVVSAALLEGAVLTVSDIDAKRFADFLYRNGEYYRAISEYKKLIYFFPESALRAEATLQIGRSYMAGGDLESAILHWNRSLEESEFHEEHSARIRLLLSISYLDRNRLDPFPLRIDNVDRALHQLDRIDSHSAVAEQGRSFAADWRSRPRPQRKSPLLAGALSGAIPGAGSLYAERYREGVYAFFVTALFYVAALEAIHKRESELAFVFGSFAIAFYGGGIYTAVNSVHKLNDGMDAEALAEIRRENGFWFVPATNRSEGRF